MTTTATRYRPLNLAAWEVRAIREGRKTQTRRLVKPQPVQEPVSGLWSFSSRRHEIANYTHDQMIYFLDMALGHPFGQPGDHLFGRESWRPYWCDELYACVQYKADRLKMKPDIQDENTAGRFVEMCDLSKDDNEPWRPSTQMPRWASRIDLLIKSVRIERLQEISEVDAIAEGARPLPLQNADDPSAWWEIDFGQHQCRTPQGVIRSIWQPHWNANPFVWVIEHERVK